MSQENLPGSNLLELYWTYGREVAKAKGRDRLWKLPFYGTALVNVAVPAAGLISGNQEFGRFYTYNLMIPGALSTLAALGVGIWGLRRQRFGHINDLAIQIAETEGRVAVDPEMEARRAYQVLSLAGVLAKRGSAQIERSFVQTPLLRDISKKLEEVQVKGVDRMENLRFKQWELFLNSDYYVDKTMRDEIGMDSLHLADLYWDQVANNPGNPDDQRRYAYQMRSKIRRQMSSKSKSTS